MELQTGLFIAFDLLATVLVILLVFKNFTSYFKAIRNQPLFSWNRDYESDDYWKLYLVSAVLPALVIIEKILFY